MESFVDAGSRKPIDHIEIAEGETKVIGLKKFSLNSAKFVWNPAVVLCHDARHLADMSKHKYKDHDPKFEDFHWRKMSSFYGEMLQVTQDDLLFLQICGKAAGKTELKVPFVNAGADAAPYANSVSIVVKENKKVLALVPEKGFASPTFDILWKNHPLNPLPDGPVNYPCTTNKSKGEQPEWGKSRLANMQCMVRLCTALEKSGVNFAGLTGGKCDLPGAQHAHHFSNPYDFPNWSRAKNSCYVWEAKPPLQPEPMPGLAAFGFMNGRQGIVLFDHYFDIPGAESMFGGHIDLWNNDRMGNTYSNQFPTEGESAFFRAKKIAFWPVA